MDPNAPNQQTNQPQTAPQVVADMAQAAQPVVQQAVNNMPVVPPAKSIWIVFEEDLKFEITPDVVDDMRFMDLYAEVSEDELKISKLMRFLLTPAGYESIFQYYESKGQRFSITKFGEVFEKLDKDLNSQPDFLRG